jgi:hypothetical protein
VIAGGVRLLCTLTVANALLVWTDVFALGCAALAFATALIMGPSAYNNVIG